MSSPFGSLRFRVARFLDVEFMTSRVAVFQRSELHLRFRAFCCRRWCCIPKDEVYPQKGQVKVKLQYRDS